MQSDQKLYATECASSPGFLQHFNSTKQAEYVPWERFKGLCRKWQHLLVQTLRVSQPTTRPR
eukprot:scaffold18237_cov18-Prasinocladus_malaysianus.AAC.2